MLTWCCMDDEPQRIQQLVLGTASPCLLLIFRGPLLGQLKNGQAVTLDDGRVVNINNFKDL